jgi:hypothetical protein
LVRDLDEAIMEV